MKARFVFVACISVVSIGLSWSAASQPTMDPSPLSSEQQEADDRVVAARCGTPLFERGFYKQSKAAVASGLVVKHRDPVQVEKNVTALRRNPVVLIATQADCPAQLDRLRQIEKDRAKMLGTHRKGAQIAG
jgi:hypothetical protein